MIFAGIDPGGRHVAACLLRRRAPHHALVSALSFDVEAARTAEHLRAAVAKVVAYVEPGAVACGVETIHDVHGSPRMGTSYAQGLASCSLLAGRLAQALEGGFLEVRTPSREEVRRALCGSASADDATVKRVVMARIAGWPKVSNTHERDAALVALWTAETWAREALARRARP